MSIAFVYSLKVNMISGARYQRVATYCSSVESRASGRIGKVSLARGMAMLECAPPETHLGHEARRFLLADDCTTCKTKVADLEIAVGVQEQVGRPVDADQMR